MGVLEHGLLGVAALIAVTVLAYLLQAVTPTVVRLYEGYNWGRLDSRLTNWARLGQKRKLQNLQETSFSNEEGALKAGHQRTAYSDLYYNFPRNPNLILPTRLGNTLIAAEEYSYQVYFLDAVTWWPRLAPLLPQAFRAQVDNALTPLLALLNLLALVGGALVFLTDQRWWLFVLVFVGALLLARFCYAAAVKQAESYGILIRVAFDLYRHEILKQMHIPIPDNLVDEGVLWSKLNRLVYNYIQPWETKRPSETLYKPDPKAHPFYYDFHYPPPLMPEGKTEVAIKFPDPDSQPQEEEDG